MIPRERAIETLESDRFDLLVIGGGITGAGVALDAASRGYSVALVEKADFASGTSSRSSKLIHGGLRYLQKFDLGLVREARFSARREHARTVADVRLRRTRLGLVAAPDLCARDSRVPAYVAKALARELGWASRRVATELERFAEEAAAEGICAA